MRKFFLIFILILATSISFAQPTSVSSIGEADIVNGDKASARLVAIARAKWAALEDVAGVKVKSDTVLQNAMLVDEAVKTEVQGVVTAFKVTGEEEDGNIYRVQILASIEKTKAENAVGAIAKNTSISVMIPVIFPDGRVEEASALSETVIGELAARNMEVVDISQSSGISVKDIQNSIKTGNFNNLRDVALKNLSNTILIGEVETVATAQQGADIGYGVTLPFNVVTGRLTYRLVTEKYGNKVVLASGYIPVRGQGTTLNDATYRMTENLRDKVAQTLVSIVMEKIKGVNSRSINVRLMGGTNVEKLMQLKNMLTYTSWVLDIKENGADSLTITYPEKTLYLASSVDGRNGFKVEKFSDYELVLSYK